MRCRKHCENRHQQFSPAFETGDDIAILALKDVLISLQGEVIQALHIARAVENAVLDFTTLHETSVTNRKDATRAMDQLCQRIMASMQYGLHKSEARDPSASSMQSSFASLPLSSYDLPPSPPASVGSPRQPDYQRATSQRTLTIRPPSDKVDQRGSYNAPQASPLGWIRSQVNHSSSDLAAGYAPSSTAGKGQQSHQSPDDLELERRSQFSMQYSAPGSEKGSVHLQPAGVTSTTTSRYPQDPSTRAQAASEHPPQRSQQGTASTERAVILASGTHRQNSGGSLGDKAEALSTRSRTTKPHSQCLPRIETVDDLQPDFDAPEVVSGDFEGIYPVPDQSEKYPAFLTQSDYAERLLSLPAGMDNIWMPLKRPAMHNRYHGFCTGAWKMRKAVRSCFPK
jgi:hypothetical protein